MIAFGHFEKLLNHLLIRSELRSRSFWLNDQNRTSYLRLAPLKKQRNVREMHHGLVLLEPLCALNAGIVSEAQRHSSECTLAQQTRIVQTEGSKEARMNACFSVHKRPL